MALAITEAAYSYFYTEILTPSTNPSWTNFIDANAVNFINFNGWIKAIFKGALIGYTQSTVMTPTPAADGTGIGNNLVTTIMGAFVTTYGKIIFRWAKRPVMVNNANGSNSLSL